MSGKNETNDSVHEARWRGSMLAIDSTIQQAILKLNEFAIRIVLVVNDAGELQGTISDGDIRRGLLKGLDLNSSIASVVRQNALVVPPEVGRETVVQLMLANNIQQLPIVDQNHRVVGLHLWNEINAPLVRPNLMIIMAGGQGMRLRPHTETCQKPMLKIGGKPMLEHIIERAKAEGFRRFVLAIYFLGHMIEDYFGDGSRWHVQIDYLREATPLGTAGAIGLLMPRPEAAFVVSNGDVLTDIRYCELLDFHLRHAASATMAVRLYEWQHPFGVVRTDGVDMIGFEEKPVARSHINAGIYVLNPDALDSLKTGEQCDMPTLFCRLRERAARTIVYPMHEPWLDVGTIGDFERAQSEPSPGG